MKQKLYSRRTANRLIIGGASTFVGSIVLSLIVLFSVYSMAGNCNAIGCESKSLAWQSAAAHFLTFAAYLGLFALFSGVILLVAVRNKK